MWIAIVLLALSTFSLPAVALGGTDSVIMKNGDAFRGAIIDNQPDDYVQIRLSDGNEKRIQRSQTEKIPTDVDPAKVEKTDAAPQPTSNSDSVPNESRFAVEFFGLAFDGHWSSKEYESNGKVFSSAKTINRRVKTVLPQIAVSALYGTNELRAVFDTGESHSTGLLSLIHSRESGFGFGLASLVSINEQIASISNTSLRQIDSNIAIGPIIKERLNMDRGVSMELTLAAMLDFVSIQNDQLTTAGVAHLTGSGAVMLFCGSVRQLVPLTKNISYFFHVSLSTMTASIDGDSWVSSSNARSIQTVLAESSAIVVPLGLKVIF